MDDLAMTTTLERDDHHPVVAGVLPGRLTVGPGYDTVRSHGLAEWLIMLTIGGRGRLRPAGAAWVDLGPRSIVAYRPGTPQDYGTAVDATSWDVLWAHLHPRPDWLPLLEWPTCAAGIGRLDLSPLIAERTRAALERAVAHHVTGLGQARPLAMNAVEEALLWCDAENPRSDPTDATLRAVLEHVSAHMDAPHTLASLAAVTGMSPSHLGRTIRATTGTSVMAAVERIRMDAARELLAHTDLTVTQVAARVGYPDPLYFSRRFRRDAGISPRIWRLRSEP